MQYVVYGIATCEWCKRAVKLLEEKSMPYEYRPLEEERHLRSYKVHFPTKTSVPQIMWMGDFGETDYVGGYDDLKIELG